MSDTMKFGKPEVGRSATRQSNLKPIPPPLVPVEERERAEKLWQLLDDIDTASDAIKPDDLAGYERFYRYALAMCEKRHQYLKSDGYVLTDPETT